MSSSKGLDQLCAAACDTALGSPLPNENPGEIKVREIEAYASVADLIHAAIVANSGAASLKEIYEVCEEHGRIAYRRADGSRLITSNDHWKSQVRHALYTGGRFERVPSNGEYWQLTPASRGSSAELVKVLVRADDEYLHIRATLDLTPSAARISMPKSNATAAATATMGHDSRLDTGGTARQRRKRTTTASPTTAAAAEAGSIEAMCDSIDPAGTGAVMRAPPASLRQQRGRLPDSNAPDNHSTQDEDFDEVRDLPRQRAKRVSRKPTWKVANASEDDEEALVAAAAVAGASRPYNHYTNQALKYEIEDEVKYNTATHQRHRSQYFGGGGAAGAQHVHQASKDSADPSTLRWGSTCLRSTYIISATAGDSSGLSAGRTPLVPGRRLTPLGGAGGGGGALPGAGAGGNGGGQVRDTSAEADSAPMKKWRQTTHAHRAPTTTNTDADINDDNTAGPPSKRQAVAAPHYNSTRGGGGGGVVPTPQAHAEGPGGMAHMTPPFISQWAEAMQHHLEEAAAVAQQQKQSTVAGAGSNAAVMAAAEAAAAAAAAGWPSSSAAGAGIPGFPAGFPPMAMLPAMLPGLIAAAAPYFSSQQAQQQMQQHMQAFMVNPGAAAATAAAAAATAAQGPGVEEK